MMSEFKIKWEITMIASSKKEAAENAAAVLFDQSQEFLTIEVNGEKIDLINGVAKLEPNQTT